ILEKIQIGYKLVTYLKGQGARPRTSFEIQRLFGSDGAARIRRERFPCHPPSRFLLQPEPRVGFRGAPPRRRPARERTAGGGKNHRLLYFEPVVGWRGVLSDVGRPKDLVLSGGDAAGVPFERQSVQLFTR